MFKIIVTAVLFFIAGFASAVWWFLHDPSPQSNERIEEQTTREAGMGGVDTSAVAPQTTENTESLNTPEVTPTVIDTSNLSDGQKTLLRSLSIDTDTLIITPAMTTCAEAELGEARLAEIIAGETPSFLEGLTLTRCYGQ